MRASIWAALIASVCALVAVPASAQTAPAASRGDWVVRGEALARRIQAGNLILTANVRAEREEAAARATGEQRLQALYDLASDDYIGSDAQAAAISLAALEREANAQHSARFLAMVSVLRAYAPALEGDYVAAQRNLAAILTGVDDPIVRAAGARLHAYALTDLGMFANSLEAARSGLVHLPDTALTRSLRSGLHDAMAYNAVRIGDYNAALEHLERTVELDTAAGKPVDGVVIVHNVASMMAQAGAREESLRLVAIHSELAARTGLPVMRFFGSFLCAKVHFLAQDYAAAVRCADEGRAIDEAPPEYMTRLLVFRLHALARLNRGTEARAALSELRTLAAERGDPGLSEKLDAIEPEVLNAEGRFQEAFAAMRGAHEAAERNQTLRFNDGVKELRATMESEVAQAEERAQAEAMRSELQARTLEKMTLAILLAGACLIGLVAVAYLIYRSRRAMLQAVGRAEEVLARRGADVEEVASPKKARPTERLRHILDEIERRDVELEAAFMALESARMAAEDANVAKSQFLTTMSHELRTPLNAIIGYCEILQETVEGQLEQQDLSRIHAAGHRLLAMINDVLDLSKIEAGRMTPDSAHVELEAMLEEVVATVTPAAAANGNTVVLDRQTLLGGADTDGFKLSQCLLNLMSNAAKFTRDGQIKLRARREAGAFGDTLVFDVVDTGIGIAPDAQARLFQPFVQADATTTRAYGGTGLGLAITRRLAQLLGGDVTVKSALGQGACFTLKVPAKLAHAPIPANDDTKSLTAA
ncbi:ATP-binding protein [Terricaulis sp.]|uniref:ATP-binding protein n=1 Tax=Terricaulis sp. TaxID=2768686 RepID=UPI003784E048